MPRRAARRARRGTKLGAGLAGVGGLEDFAAAAERLGWQLGVRAIGAEVRSEVLFECRPHK